MGKNEFSNKSDKQVVSQRYILWRRGVEVVRRGCGEGYETVDRTYVCGY